jgi:hypothetical protein
LTYAQGTAGAATVAVVCVSSARSSYEKIVTCSSPVTPAGAGHWPAAGFATSLRFSSANGLPGGFDRCLSTALAPLWPTGNAAGSILAGQQNRSVVKSIHASLSKCERD